ncbi:MAG: hypothetical protein LBN39_02655 [Planctomycetaceae bacterium]|jgi:hypothetical protein|nr:hypothetical protein [Planctomycetaceae bacterium]
MPSFEDISKLYDTLLKVEALYSGASTPGEKNAAGAAAERIRQKIDEYIDSDPPREIKCSFSNMWSKRLFCAWRSGMVCSPTAIIGNAIPP